MPKRKEIRFTPMEIELLKDTVLDSVRMRSAAINIQVPNEKHQRTVRCQLSTILEKLEFIT